MRPRWPPTMHSNLHMRHVTQSQNSKFPRWRKLVEAKVVRPQMYRVLMIKWGDLWALNPRKKSPFVFCVLVWLDRVKQRLFRYFKNIFSCAVRARSHLQVQNWICKYVVCHFVFTSPLFAGMYFSWECFPCAWWFELLDGGGPVPVTPNSKPLHILFKCTIQEWSSSPYPLPPRHTPSI